ncbi:hypothetical protein PV326_001203 [Microctonus aethiopoides]|nr:hypothetical protein PV326_001203 [Microctonus aethiopoides]
MNRIRARSKHGRRESTTNCWIYGSLTGQFLLSGKLGRRETTLVNNTPVQYPSFPHSGRLPSRKETLVDEDDDDEEDNGAATSLSQVTVVASTHPFNNVLLLLLVLQDSIM